MVACGRMTAKRLSLPQLGAILCTAFALWVSFGSLGVTGAAASARLGVLPSPWWLAATLSIGVSAAGIAVSRVILLWLSAVIAPASPPLPVPAAMRHSI